MMDPRLFNILASIANIPIETIPYDGEMLIDHPDEVVFMTWSMWDKSKGSDGDNPPHITVGMVKQSRILLEEAGEV